MKAIAPSFLGVGNNRQEISFRETSITCCLLYSPSTRGVSRLRWSGLLVNRRNQSAGDARAHGSLPPIFHAAVLGIPS